MAEQHDLGRMVCEDKYKGGMIVRSLMIIGAHVLYVLNRCKFFLSVALFECKFEKVLFSFCLL